MLTSVQTQRRLKTIRDKEPKRPENNIKRTQTKTDSDFWILFYLESYLYNKSHLPDNQVSSELLRVVYQQTYHLRSNKLKKKLTIILVSKR